MNLHICFKLSSARQGDYTKLQELTEVATQYVLQQSLVQWLTMKCCHQNYRSMVKFRRTLLKFYSKAKGIEMFN